MSARKSVTEFRDAVRRSGAAEVRMPLGDDEAIELAKEMTPAELRHPELVKTALDSVASLSSTKEPAEFEARLQHLQAHAEARKKFWDAFEGQEVSGVEIIRRRA